MNIEDIKRLTDAVTAVDEFSGSLKKMRLNCLKALVSEFSKSPEPLIDILNEQGVPSLVLLECTEMGREIMNYLLTIGIEARLAQPERNFSGIAFFYDTEIKFRQQTFDLGVEDREK